MEENDVIAIEENGLVETKKTTFHWAKLWAWSSIILSTMIPVVGIGLGILSLSMVTEENYDEVYTVSIIGMGIGGFFVLLDVILNFLATI